MAVAKYKIVRKCPVCGEEFFARTLESWYCSPKCSKVAWKRKHDEEKRQLELDKIVSNMPKSKEYISITEAYAMFGASRSTIYRLIYMKKISFIEPEKGIRLVCKGELMNLFPLRQSPLDTKPRKPVTMYRRSQQSWIAMRLPRDMVFRLLQTVVSSIQAMLPRQSQLVQTFV